MRMLISLSLLTQGGTLDSLSGEGMVLVKIQSQTRIFSVLFYIATWVFPRGA